MSGASQAKLAGFIITMFAIAWMGIDSYILLQAVREGSPRNSIGEIANAVRVAAFVISASLYLGIAIIAGEIAKLRTSRPTTTISPKE